MIKDFDHVVLTTADLDKCLDFYTRVLGMRLERFGEFNPTVIPCRVKSKERLRIIFANGIAFTTNHRV